jgi:hypothetical protein
VLDNKISFIVPNVKLIPMFNCTRLLYHYSKSIFILLLFSYTGYAQELYPVALKNRAWHGEERVLRYHPEGADFVITNGKRRFNRALYGTNTAFRVEAGDLPEFSLYMPGLGGTLQLGIARGNDQKWLIKARKITARYTPGRMTYEIEDPILGKSKLHLSVLALTEQEGMVIKAELTGPEKDITLIYAFGGASGKKFSRSGDMGPDPESVFYLKAENCVTNQYTLRDNSFGLHYGKDGEAKLEGFFPSAAKIADAGKLSEPVALHASTGSAQPLVTAAQVLVNGKSIYAVIRNPLTPTNGSTTTTNNNNNTNAVRSAFAIDASNSGVALYSAAEKARQKIAGRIKVSTPDPYINTIGGAISIAADAIWEAPSYLHGAVGWRMRLNGWRGPYAGDPLGWHDRARTHYQAYAKSQLTAPLSGPVIADTAFHLARHQEKMGTSMFTSGYISRDPDGKSLRPHHYDMNLVYIDGLLWHFNWTGDLDFAKKMWPVLQRHFEWEKRNFDADNDGLYDAYAVIWASDALYYSGGAVTHSSAYNYRANKKAAEIALLIGEDATPYQLEAARILKAINTQLWMPGKGVYAEYKDAMGLKNLHTNAALWTIYHSIDSDVPDAFQAWQSLRFIDQEIPHIPVRGRGLPAGQYYTLSTSSWMPYTWSINNVVMAESMHTALANWQTGRNEEGFKLFKSELLAAMYLGGSPGNFVQISHYDAVRAEAYRDFGDPVGISSRTLIEGLFGVVPDALHRRLTIRPGFPSGWAHAALTTPDIDYKFKRTGNADQYNFKLSFAQPLALNLQLKARGSAVGSVLVNGKKTDWKIIADAVGHPMIEIAVPAAGQYEIRIVWTGEGFIQPAIHPAYAAGNQLSIDFKGATILKINDPQQAFQSAVSKNNILTATTGNQTGNRTVFIQLKKGNYTWWYPVCFELKAPVSLIPVSAQGSGQLSFQITNNSNRPVNGVLHIKDFEKQLSLQPGDTSSVISLSGALVSAGTNQLVFDSGVSTKLEVTNWNINHQMATQRSVNMGVFFNDQVTEIFKHQYLSPRPVGPTLQLPWQGIGDWPHALEMVNIDDSGLRRMAGTANEFTLPQGIRFSTPGEPGKRNILFTSRWDNYPSEVTIPLEGKAAHAYFLMAGSTNHMQSQFDNGKVVVTYTDNSTEELILRNPETWWPIEEDYYTDGFAFDLKKPRPPRIHLKTGNVDDGRHKKDPVRQMIDGGAATVADLPLNPKKTLKSLQLVTLANDVVIGLMSVTLTGGEL